MPKALLLIAAGAALGAVSRYGIYRWMAFHGLANPWATFAVNALGAFALGLVVAQAQFRPGNGSQFLSLFAGVGFLGAFTTFSAFSRDLHDMLVARAFSPTAVTGPMLFAFAQVGLCLALYAAGLRLGIRFDPLRATGDSVEHREMGGDDTRTASGHAPRPAFVQIGHPAEEEQLRKKQHEQQRE